MIDLRIISHLKHQNVGYCLIGGLALAAWGVVRYTADADLLTLDSRVLDPSLWFDWGTSGPRITRGDSEDPLGGVVRFAGPPKQDLILGRGEAARIALETAERSEAFPCPVASPCGLILLKLEAGSPQDAADILALLGNAQSLGRPDLRAEILSQIPLLSGDARAFWTKVSAL